MYHLDIDEAFHSLLFSILVILSHDCHCNSILIKLIITNIMALSTLPRSNATLFRALSLFESVYIC